MLPRSLLLLALPLALLPSTARATSFRLPLADCDQPTKCVDTNKCYATAYYDHSGHDWYCGGQMYQGHQGTDFGVSWVVGVRPVVAGASGTVIETNDGCGTGAWGNTCGGGYGNYVKLLHADGKVTVYGHLHLGTLKVSSGASVACGQELGRVGNSGNSTGPHLHFEVVDPTYGVDDPFSGSCGGPLSYWVTQGAYCRLPGIVCEGACTPSCGGKDCGPDGCGGSCGTCPAGETCFGDGLCAGTAPDDAAFVSETIPDGTHFAPGATFTKTWTLQNLGATPWTKAGGYSLAFQSGEDFGAPARTWPGASESIAPNATKTWSVQLTAPTTPGTWRGTWQMDRNGVPFGPQVWVEIVVDAAEVDAAAMVAETVPDGTRVVAGSAFTKTWTLQNTGTSTWTRAGGYQWTFQRGAMLGASTAVLLGSSESVAPGGSRVWSVPMVAPATPGTYRGYWTMTRNGASFGDEVWVEVVVTASVPTDQDGDGHFPLSGGGDDCDDGDPNVFPGNPERCDAKDNDCSGVTDEGLTRDCVRQGCRGLEACSAGAWVGCSAPTPQSETCNGVDDDCNGFTDDEASCPSGQVCVAAHCVAGPPDAGAPRPDAGSPRPDAGTPRLDAGNPRPDAGTPRLDAGTPRPDSGTSRPDAAALRLDAGRSDASTSTCVPDVACESDDGCSEGTTTCASGVAECTGLVPVADLTPCEGGVCRDGTCVPPADGGAVDAAMNARDGSTAGADAATGPGDRSLGCGCQGGAGSAWSGGALFLLSLLGRRRRASTTRR